MVYSGEIFPVRHIVEGMFTYFDVCLIFITATFFMTLVKRSGGVAFIVRKIVATFKERRMLYLPLLTLVVLIPGALTGSGAATTVLTVGGLVGTVLAAVMGVNETKRTAAIFITAAMTPQPLDKPLDDDGGRGANMPYVGYLSAGSAFIFSAKYFLCSTSLGAELRLMKSKFLNCCPNHPAR